MSASPDDCIFLGVDLVREIHAEAIAGFGGSDRLRDRVLLESAVAAPQATFGGQSVYQDIPEVAAAYLFYLCRNHPFVAGDKRVALGACILFLRLNGDTPAPDGPDWESLVLDVAASKLDRDQTTARLRGLLQTSPAARMKRKRSNVEDPARLPTVVSDPASVASDL